MPIAERFIPHEPFPELDHIRKIEITGLRRGNESTKEDLRKGLLSPYTVTILLKNQENIIGYTVAVPMHTVDDEFPSLPIAPGTKVEIQKKKKVSIGNKKTTDNSLITKTAYIMETIITPTEQSKKYVGILMKKLEKELRELGYLYLARSAAINNGYADKILHFYNDRILGSKQVYDINFGEQMFIFQSLYPLSK